MENKKIENGFATAITAQSLTDLITNKISAIRIGNFMTGVERDLALRNVRYHTQNTTYLWSNDFSVIGTSVGEAHENADKEASYFEQAPETNRLLQNNVFPFGSPMSRVGKMILDAWEPGLKIAHREGEMFLPEIVRHWRTGGGAHPHIDQTVTPLLAHLGLEKRLGCNVYMDMPSEGGSIEFWNRRFTDEEYKAAKRSDYGLDREILGEPSLKIRPNAPEMVLFDASQPHAVEPASGHGDRIVNAAFFAFGGYDKPLIQFA